MLNWLVNGGGCMARNRIHLDQNIGLPLHVLSAQECMHFDDDRANDGIWFLAYSIKFKSFRVVQ